MKQFSVTYDAFIGVEGTTKMNPKKNVNVNKETLYSSENKKSEDLVRNSKSEAGVADNINKEKVKKASNKSPKLKS